MAFTSDTVICKQPGETIDVVIDFSTWLAAQTLATPSVTSEILGGGATDLTITLVAVSGQTVTMRIAGGTANKYRIEATVNVSDGQILEGDGILTVSDK